MEFAIEYLIFLIVFLFFIMLSTYLIFIITKYVKVNRIIILVLIIVNTIFLVKYYNINYGLSMIYNTVTERKREISKYLKKGYEINNRNELNSKETKLINNIG
ncbi:MAG: hypothetical protein ACK5HR_03115 [Mycoplasmatales bacterium]